MKIERGNVYWADLDPVRSSEMAKTRPCVVVSDSSLNASRRTVVVVPLTRNPRAYIWSLLFAVPDFNAGTKIRPDQIRAVNKARLKRHIGTFDEGDVARIGEALRLVLHLQ